LLRWSSGIGVGVAWGAPTDPSNTVPTHLSSEVAVFMAVESLPSLFDPPVGLLSLVRGHFGPRLALAHLFDVVAELREDAGGIVIILRNIDQILSQLLFKIMPRTWVGLDTTVTSQILLRGHIWLPCSPSVIIQLLTVLSGWPFRCISLKLNI